MADGVYVSIGGDSKKLQQANDEAVKSLREVGQAIDEVGKRATGTSSTSGTYGGSKGLDQYRFSLDSLKGSLLENMGQFGAFMLTLNSTFGVIGQITGVIGGAVDGFLQLAGTIGGVVVDAVRMAADEIGTLTQQVFELNQATEKNFYNWAYLYGGPKGGGVQAAGELARWSKQFSLQIPFTRQDLMAAITTLSAEDNANPQDIEKQLSLISDVAATQGRPGLTLQWAAMAALRASQPGGSARMLMMDLNLNKTELAKYGYDEKDSTTFFPALEAYERAKGSYGASAAISQQTMWGALTSAQDRLQNMGLQVGGWNDNPKTLTDDVKKGSMFYELKKDLVDITDWWDKHSKDISRIADLFGNVLGGAVKDVTIAFQGLMDGLHMSGLDKLLEQLIGGLGKWLNDPAVQSGIKNLTDAFAQMAGTAIVDVFQAAGNFFDALGRTGVPQAAFNTLVNFFNTMGAFFKDHKQEINDFFFHLGTVTGQGMKEIGDAFKQLGESFKRFKDSMTPEDWANLKWFLSEATIGTIKHMADAFAGVIKTVSQLVDELTKIKQLMEWINQHTGGAAYGAVFGGGGGSSGGGSGGGGGGGSGGRRMADIIGPTQMALNNVKGSALVGGGSGGGNVSTTSSSTSNLYGGHSTNSVTIHAAAEVQIERIAKRVMAEADAAQNVFSRRVGGYRPGLFGSIG